MDRHKKPLTIRSEMAIWAALKAVTLTLALTAISVFTITAYIERESHDDVAILANDVAQAFDHRMAQNYRMMEMAVGLDILRDRWASPYQKSTALANLQTTFPDCLWIGLADRQGIIRATGDGHREQRDVSAEHWFVEGRRQPMISPLQPSDDLGLVALASADDQRVINLARPVRDPLGNVIGVLGATISWKWAVEFRDMLLGNRGTVLGIEILVTDKAGRVMIGPEALMDQVIDLRPEPVSQGVTRRPKPINLDIDAKSGLTSAMRLRVRHWPDGGDYISAVGIGTGYQDFPGLGWNIVVRQPRDIAYAPARAIRDRLVVVGICLAALFAVIGWLVANRITRPIRKLTALARRLDRGERGIAFHTRLGNHEVTVLGETLDHLVGNLLQREQQLLDLNVTLERRIDERTALLAASNRQLEGEMAQRQAVEQEREALIQQLRDQAEHDSLTGALNRRAFLTAAERDRRRQRRENGRVAVIMFDIDHFKHVNDTYGHLAGDEVIRKMAATARAVVRESDLLCRYGGEEFALLLADPGAENAALVAERLRAEVARLTFTVPPGKTVPTTAMAKGTATPGGSQGPVAPAGSGVFQVTISLGVTIAAARELPEDGVVALLDLADQALYRAKHGGRNRVAVDPKVADSFDGDRITLEPNEYTRDFPRSVTTHRVANDG
jgi:diguanylate cyclase (GGDEF)-like protein